MEDALRKKWFKLFHPIIVEGKKYLSINPRFTPNKWISLAALME